MSSTLSATPAAATSPATNGLAAALAPALLQWFERSGRKHLPWQQNRTAYRIWVSEIMLQQTQVTTVIPYYETFMERFPTAAALATAPVDEVLHLWSGLGYYARARNLHRAAQTIMHRHGGEFPHEFADVTALPGIGRSTAGAILALSQNRRYAILDGNVKRVLARYFGVDGFPGAPAIEKQLWERAEAATPAARVDEYTQAIMDLGATVCVRSRPVCLLCPLCERCAARAAGRQSELPAPRPKKARPQRHAHIVIALRRDGAILLERRPPAGIWGGLWCFPEFADMEAASVWIGSTLGVSASSGMTLNAYDHGFSHFDLRLHPILIRTGEGEEGGTEAIGKAVAEVRERLWYQPKDPSRIGLAAPVAMLIVALSQDGVGWQDKVGLG